MILLNEKFLLPQGECTIPVLKAYIRYYLTLLPAGLLCNIVWELTQNNILVFLLFER